MIKAEHKVLEGETSFATCVMSKKLAVKQATVEAKVDVLKFADGSLLAPLELRFCVTNVTMTLVFCSSVCAQDGLELFHRKSWAGLTKSRPFGTMMSLFHAQTWHDDGSLRGDVQKRTRWINTGYLRLDQVGQNDNTYVLYFDGKSGWGIVPEKSGVVELVGDELKFVQGYVRDLRFKSWLADGDPKLSVHVSRTECDSDLPQT